MSTLRNSCTALLFCSAPLAPLVGCGSERAVVPTSFAMYNSAEEKFICEYPEGWEANGGGKHGRLWAKFASGSALIQVKSSVVGNLLSDAQRSASSDGGLAGFEPVDGLHGNLKAEAEEEFDSYTELPGSPMVLNCKLGPARTSEFTGKSTFGSNIHGYRATVVGHDLGLVIFCTCLEDQWQALKPAFDHLLGSLERG